jgi:thiol-disulfide isomerase/thioredoxin
MTRHRRIPARPWALLLAAFVAVFTLGTLTSPAGAAASDDDNSIWYEVGDDDVTVDLHFVWSSSCPHCREAHPFIEELEDRYDWLQVNWLQVNGDDPAAVDTAIAVADSIGQTIPAVPTFLYCETMRTGYDDADGIGAVLEDELETCHARLVATHFPDGTAPPSTTETEQDEGVTLPIIGRVDASAVSLPIFTVTVAGLDAFNPCAFFVLLFLLSLLVHAKNRMRMAVIGGVFVLFSGLIYFAFMTAWLNVFLITGTLRWITLAAGAVAVVIALFNIKDYFAPGTGASLSIPESAKPGLFKRMRTLAAADRYPAILAGTVTLALAANSYELLCTAGLPMAFTRVLTLNDLPTSTYYGYLVLYNVIYVIPLLVIVAVFVWALGSRKLQEHEGRTLKLLSGTMMLGLGLVLLLAPELLDNMLTAVIVLALAVAATAAVSAGDRLRHRRRPAHR